MTEFGSAEIRRHHNEDGTERLEVVSADPVIGISVELLADSLGWGLWVDGDGLLWLAGDPRYKYRPVRFDCRVSGIGPGEAVEGLRYLICEQVTS